MENTHCVKKKTGKFYALILVDYLRSGEMKRGRRKKKGAEGERDPAH